MIFFLVISCTYTHRSDDNNHFVFGDSLYLKNIPPQPGEEAWEFTQDLKSPMWTKHHWVTTNPGNQYADLSGGVHLITGFPDPEGRLETAYEDLGSFLNAGGLSAINGEYNIETRHSADLKGESFKLEINPDKCIIHAGDTEGIRRGIFYIEDEMLRLRGPWLPLGIVERHPVVKRRISRCVYGPIKRLPFLRDELMDTVDYYPDQYLNRLAHEGVNGLWLTIDFRDLVSTRFIPESGKDAEKRLSKLRKTVDQCLRYGIRTYIFIIEPRAWGSRPPIYRDIEVLEKYPELGGAVAYDLRCFCPSSETAQEYLYQVVNKIFTDVPGLGGMINITYGERITTCLSSISAGTPYEGRIHCPRCSKKAPWEILYASLSAMQQGMHDASPDAELISWHYMGGSNLADWVYEIPKNTPEGVILQFQFETGVTKTQLGKKQVGGDYWLSTPGPSPNFERQAEIARESGTPVSAKIQTGNSHEVASIPYIPVPSMIYRKFSAMHRLGVSHTMLGWYFGNYPGLMIKSAGELSFSHFPESEDAFLNRLASLYWKDEDVPVVVEAWKMFAEGYGNYPLQNLLGYYGPFHDGVVWPLLLKPQDAPLSPTWQITSPRTLEPWPPSGDRIGECLWYGGSRSGGSMDNVLTLGETVELCHSMSTIWDEGVDLLSSLEPKYKNEPEQILEIGLAKALGIQFRSGYNILRFYLLREEMFRMEGRERLDILRELADIIREEIKSGKQLIELCKKDSRLGFHSEAEGYKYFPEKIRWRISQLEFVLSNDVPELKKLIHDNKPLFPEYTGKAPEGLTAYAVPSTGTEWTTPGVINFRELLWQSFNYGAEEPLIRWAAAYDADALYIIIEEHLNSYKQANESALSGITVKVEPRRLWPSAHFTFIPGKDSRMRNEMLFLEESDRGHHILRIPFKRFWWSDEAMHPLRLDVQIKRRNGEISSWCPVNPLSHRLVFESENPADLGWVIFEE